MAGSASAHKAATATREGTSQQRAGRRRRTSADPQRAQQGATAATTAAPAARDRLSRLQQLAGASPQVAQLRRLQALADARFAPVAHVAGDPEEEDLFQGKFTSAEHLPQLQLAPRANNTGLPDQLKSGIESLSGLSMDHVRVHYNSSQPAQLNALAYAQGSDIHLAPGQEQHLPHEAWHVVQQAQGRVRPTMQMKEGVPVNDDAGLEQEADVMGALALRPNAHRTGGDQPSSALPHRNSESATSQAVAQRQLNRNKKCLHSCASSMPAAFQLLKNHAGKFIGDENLGINNTKEDVQSYVSDTKNDRLKRLGLLQAWNKRQKPIQWIHVPEDLDPGKVEMRRMDNFENWDSDEDTDIAIKETIENKMKPEKLTLKRQNGTIITDVPHLELSDAIRLGRQIVKQNKYDCLPFVVQVGSQYIEYNNPAGNKDIYATPLEEIGKATFKREGRAADFSFANLTRKLNAEAKRNPEPKKQRLDDIFSTFYGKSGCNLSKAQSETIAAISCDFMKGSNAIKFIEEARMQLDKEGEHKIENYFTGDNPIYIPAQKRGRKRVTEATEEKKKKQKK